MSGDFKVQAAEKKVPLALLPLRALFGMARVFGYGAKKYAPGNFLKATLADGAAQRYHSAMLRHLAEIQEPDGTWSRESLAVLDGESGLPHLDHLICGMVMLRAILVKEGVLPADPGIGKEPEVQFDSAFQTLRDYPPQPEPRPTSEREWTAEERRRWDDEMRRG
jgi:hypothetical protein